MGFVMGVASKSGRTDPNTKATGATTWPTARDVSFTAMAMFTKASGSMIKLTEKAPTSIWTELNIPVNG